MAGNLPHCDICSLRDIFKLATVWCSECNESICSECQEHHWLSKATSGHPILPIEDFLKLPDFVRAINIRCEEHKDKFDWYCTKHAAPCCGKCLKVNHENCLDIKPIREIDQNIKSSSAFSEIESRCTHLRDVYKTMEDEKIQHIQKVDSQATTILDLIQYRMLDIIRHLDNLEQKLRDDVKEKKAQLKENIVLVTTKLNTRGRCVQTFLTQYEDMKRYASNHQTLLWLYKIDKDINSEIRILPSLKATQFDLKFVPSNNLNTILDFGKIDALSTPLNIRFDKTNQVQIPTGIQTVVDIDNISLKERDRGKAIEVLDFLPNDTYLVRDGKQLYQFSTSGKLINEYGMLWKPQHTIHIDDKNIVVLFGNAYKICIFNMAANVMKTVINCITNDVKSNIVFNDNNLFYIASAYMGNEIKIVNILDRSILSHDCRIVFKTAHISKYKDMQIYYSHGRKVTCCDMKGNTIWENTDPLLIKPTGICCDSNGIVYVVDVETEQLFGFSPDGQRVKVLLDKSAGLKSPYSVVIGSNKNQLIINGNKERYQYDIVWQI